MKNFDENYNQFFLKVFKHWKYLRLEQEKTGKKDAHIYEKAKKEVSRTKSTEENSEQHSLEKMGASLTFMTQ